MICCDQIGHLLLKIMACSDVVIDACFNMIETIYKSIWICLNWNIFANDM